MGTRAEAGLAVVGTYTPIVIGVGNTAKVTALLAELLAVIPDPDVAPAQGGGNDLEKMTASAAAQISVEIAAALAAVSDT